jgi:endoglucanase
MTVQWQKAVDAAAAERGEWVDIDGASDTTYVLDETTPEMDGTVYRAVFTNPSGSVATDAARLSVWVAPLARLAVTPGASLVSSFSTRA